MITEDIIRRLYNVVISTVNLTERNLHIYGFSQDTINELVDKNILKTSGPKKYKLNSVDDLYNYGMNLLYENKHKLAASCFHKCYLLDPTHLPSNLQYAYNKIRQKYYIPLLKNIGNLSKNNNQETKNLYDIYLYLLNYITEIPLEYQELINNINLSNNHLLEKDIIDNIKENEFVKALKSFNIMLEKDNSLHSIEMTILKELLSQASDIERENERYIIKLISEENYQELILLLEEQEKHNIIKESDKYLLILINILINIKETKEIPNIKVSNTDNLLEAINGNNFELAYKINSIYIQNNGLSKNNPINILLEKINELIKYSDFSNVLLEILSEAKSNIENEEIKELINSKILVKEIINSKDIDNILNLIKQFLIQNNKEEYYQLLLNITKLSILDNNFYQISTIIKSIEQNTYIFEKDIYIIKFYLYLIDNKLEQAKICVDILKQSNCNKLVILKLESIFEEFKVNPVLIPKNISKIKDNLYYELLQTIIEEKEFILSCVEKMKKSNNPILLINSIPAKTRKIIHQIAFDIKEIRYQSIGEEPKDIVLRYVNKDYVDMNRVDIIHQANEAFYKKDYKKCIELNLLLIQNPSYTIYRNQHHAKIYARLGISYMCTKNINEAIKYLKIATEINKKDPNGSERYNFTDLIYRLENNIPKSENTKTENYIPISTKVEELNRVDLLEEKAYYIKQENLTEEEAKEKLELTNSDMLYIKLIYARDYFIEGLDELGNKLLKEVEQSNDKTNEVKKLLAEITRNKKQCKKHIKRKILSS